jgi:hypothetical protein
LTTRRALVLIVGVLLALAWAVPSIGATTGQLARLALGRANQAVHNSNLAVNSSDTAKSTANNANATAGAANATASSANATAGAAQSTAAAAQSSASQAASLATIADEVQDNFTSGFDPPSVAGTSCDDHAISRLGVLATDEVIVTPPSALPDDLIVQAFTSAGTITLRICNLGSNPVDPPSGYEFSTLR